LCATSTITRGRRPTTSQRPRNRVLCSPRRARVSLSPIPGSMACNSASTAAAFPVCTGPGIGGRPRLEVAATGPDPSRVAVRLAAHARRRKAGKRGGEWTRITLGERHLALRTRPEDLLDLDRALHRLERVSDRLHRVVELRFFGGMTHEEIAELLGVSTRTVERDWLKARLFLHREMEPDAVEADA